MSVLIAAVVWLVIYPYDQKMNNEIALRADLSLTSLSMHAANVLVRGDLAAKGGGGAVAVTAAAAATAAALAAATAIARQRAVRLTPTSLLLFSLLSFFSSRSRSSTQPAPLHQVLVWP
eukprot:6210430-Pleurochrysis_carterae.AAC.3